VEYRDIVVDANGSSSDRSKSTSTVAANAWSGGLKKSSSSSSSQSLSDSNKSTKVVLFGPRWKPWTCPRENCMKAYVARRRCAKHDDTWCVDREAEALLGHRVGGPGTNEARYGNIRRVVMPNTTSKQTCNFEVKFDDFVIGDRPSLDPNVAKASVDSARREGRNNEIVEGKTMLFPYEMLKDLYVAPKLTAQRAAAQAKKAAAAARAAAAPAKKASASAAKKTTKVAPTGSTAVAPVPVPSTEVPQKGGGDQSAGIQGSSQKLLPTPSPAKVHTSLPLPDDAAVAVSATKSRADSETNPDKLEQRKPAEVQVLFTRTAEPMVRGVQNSEANGTTTFLGKHQRDDDGDSADDFKPKREKIDQ
jgi:hypothetical protein